MSGSGRLDVTKGKARANVRVHMVHAQIVR